MTNPDQNLATKIPHRGPMHWLDHAHIDNGAIHATRHISAHHPFLQNGILPHTALIEILSQTAACDAVHTADAAGKKMRQGMLVAIRDFHFSGTARVGQTLDLIARRDRAMGPLVLFDVEARIAGALIAQGRMTFHLTLE